MGINKRPSGVMKWLCGGIKRGALPAIEYLDMGPDWQATSSCLA